MLPLPSGAEVPQSKEPVAVAKEVGPTRDGPVRDMIETGVEAQKQALASQQRIDKTVQETAELALRYKNVLKEIDDLKAYNRQLERQIANQLAEITTLTSSTSQMVEVERKLVPLMGRMTESLAEFVDLDLPFRLQERRAAIARLRALLDRPDVALSEKFRAVIAAYDSESAYGRAFSSYDGSLDMKGKPQAGQYLQVGRVALLFQTRDGKFSALWNPQTKGWDVLDQSYAEGIARGIEVARAEAPAERLLPLPLRVPEVQKPSPESKP
nr:DUF3450 domain-containing protein [Govania unica]